MIGMPLLLFKNGTKKELISFIKKGIKKNFEIVDIGIPEFINNNIIYAEPNDENMKRRDDLGEFLNRPLFILRSKNIEI